MSARTEVLLTCLALPHLDRVAQAEAALLPEEADVDPDDLAALDAAWEDKPVSFGPAAASGCHDDLVARLRAAKRPAADGAARRGASHG